MSSFQVAIPGNVSELVCELKKADKSTKLLAGGTDLVIALNEGKVKPGLIIDLSGIEEMKTIQEKEGWVFLGACATFTEIAESELIKMRFYSVAQAAAGIGSKQIRNRGTIGGNIANSSPAGDMITPLVSLGASVITVNSENTTREIPLTELITGAGKNILAKDEAILYIEIPVPKKERMTRFVKLGSRSTVSIARLNLAVNLELDGDDKIIEAEVALGAVGTTVFRTKIAEEALVGKKITQFTIESFAEALVKEVEKSIPGRHTLPYKREAVKGLACDVFKNI
ncbi:MAG: xanthine dehydrogenase family protein subunit M [Clostridiaceae bacterium]